jgi:hypothetical protein
MTKSKARAYSFLSFYLLIFGVAAVLSGCGGYGGNGGNTTQAVAVTISPKTISVKTGQTQQFTASVVYATNTAVTWQVNGTPGGDAAHGTIASTGLYTPPAAPPNPATVSVIAVSQADPTKSDTANVTVTDGTAPTAPANLAAAANSASQISLTWTPSTDNVGVTMYQIQRCAGPGCTPSTQVATSTTASFTDTGLTALTSYSYRVSATDAAANVSAFSNTATAITSASGVAVTLTPARGGLTVTQKLSLTATVSFDATNSGVTWSFTSTAATTGGMFSSPTSPSGTPVTFTAPAAAGVVTITATSVADLTKSVSATIGVTDLAGVYTYHNDISRTGANTQEYALTMANVNTTTFGKVFSCSVDAPIYAQPLWAANLSIGGVAHNVIYVATEHDTVYAFDADSNASPCVPLWTASLLDTGHGGLTGETWVTSTDAMSCSDLSPDIGIVGTPVIDATTKTMYVVSKTKNTAVTPFHQRLHALDITTGLEKFAGSPIEISASVPGTGVGSSGGMVSFDALTNNQRPALLLSGSGATSHVIVGWSSHCDNGAYHGWVMSYNGGTLAQEAMLNFSPNGIDSAVWMSGNGPAEDAAGNIYLATGNGTFDVTNTSGPTNDYGDSVVKLGPPSGGTFPILSYFRTTTIVSPDTSDTDQGSGGVLLLPPLGGNNRLLQAGKDGNIYVLDQASLGGLSSNQVAGGLSQGLWGSPTYWNGFATFGPAFGAPFVQYTVSATGNLSSSVQSRATGFNFPGPTASVSAQGTTSGTGIVWALDNQAYCTGGSNACGSTVLHAYDATSLATEIWNSTMAAGDKAGNAVKFTVPTVANGKVYIGTRGNNTGNATGSTSTPGELDVYGLKP